MKKILFVLIALCACIFANTIEDAIFGYYDASMDEDIDAYMGHLDTSDMNEEQVQIEREIALGIWERYDTERYAISGLEYTVGSDGNHAMAGYRINVTLSGAEEIEYELDYVMLLHKVGGDWKVSMQMPYEEYLDFSEQAGALAALDYVAEEEYEQITMPKDDAEPTFDGNLPQDLSGNIDSAVNSCESDEYCQSMGMGVCIKGVCSSPSGGNGGVGGEGCLAMALLASILLVAAVFGK